MIARRLGRSRAPAALLVVAAACTAVDAAAESPAAPEWTREFVQRALVEAREQGDPRRGADVFFAAATSCTSCHRVGGHGGRVGPELTSIATCLSPEEIVESLYWPARAVKPEYRASALTLADGRVLQGIVKEDGPDTVVLVDAAGVTHRVGRGDVEERTEVGSLMPANVFTALPAAQRRDLVRYLLELGRTRGLESLSHAPAAFDPPRAPLRPDAWPLAAHFVNRERVYNFYEKQAAHFLGVKPQPLLLPAFPGLDGGGHGHWGNQNDDETWKDDRRALTDLGSLQCWPLEVRGRIIPRAVCLRLGDEGDLCACFDPDTLRIEAVWRGGFLDFSAKRRGFLSPAKPAGVLLDQAAPANLPAGPHTYHGFHRHGRRVVFSYSIAGVRYLDAPWAQDGEVVREIAPADGHPRASLTGGGGPQWPEVLETRLVPGDGRPYAVDTIVPPFDNPWKSLLFFGGHDFFRDGDVAICTMQGDVWRVSGLDDGATTVRWRRIAAGLDQALGLVVVDDVVHVLGGDQITRLEDRDGDGETDFYACVSNRFAPSKGHDFKGGLERDAAGNFYTASHEGLLRIRRDGASVEVLARGFRNPDGLGLLPDGTLTVPVSEGEYTPASAICEVRPTPDGSPPDAVPNFRGPSPALPLVYLPRGLDNSSGGQAYVASDRWGPLGGRLLHFSYGACGHFLVLRDEVAGRPQGAIVPLPGEFRSGAHRGRFSPVDGQLYVSGMNGWGSYAVDDGCLQRVRYTGGTVQQPVGWRAHRNGVLIEFSAPLDPQVAGDVTRHFAQCWNYRYGPAYGSPEFSPSHYGTVGHDPLVIRSATVLPGGRRLFLEILDLDPVNQLHLHVAVGGGETRDIFATVHALADAFPGIAGSREPERPIAAHPLLRDLAMMKATVKNPFRSAIPGAREVTIEAAPNLAYGTPELRATPGEKIALTFVNPDVVPHNWVLAKPGTLAAVGALADRLIADPEAVARHYIPKTDDVVAYVDITDPGSRQTIFFTTPDRPGRHPFLCTFPGHWKLMNGQLVVAPEKPVDVAARAKTLFRRDNLVAWCIVPFDAGRRGPEARAAMLQRLGLRHFAYDWRDEHVPTFDQEWEALARNGVALDAFWRVPPGFPQSLEIFTNRGLRPSLWVTIHAPAELDQAAKVNRAADQLRPMAAAAAKAGCSIAIYNHGGWGGEPENMAAVCAAVNMPSVGIVYNQHHGHAHVPRFREALATMLPHLRFLNLNGMTPDGDTKGRKILVLGQGDLDVELARAICASGYTGPIGILNHTDHDAEARLRDNLEGLDWITGQLTGEPVPKPVPRTR